MEKVFKEIGISADVEIELYEPQIGHNIVVTLEDESSPAPITLRGSKGQLERFLTDLRRLIDEAIKEEAIELAKLQ